MFLYEFPKNLENAIFEERMPPHISKLSHSFNNPHWSFQYHYHTDETELIYFSSGEADYSINSEVHHVQAGDTLVVEAGDIHSITSNPNDPISCYTCSISNYQVKGQKKENLFLPAQTHPHFRAGEYKSSILSIFQLLESFYTMKSFESACICDGLAYSLSLIYYMLYQNAPKREETLNDSFVRDVLIYINENYASPITLKTLSQAVNMSTDYISHEFTKQYGISPINYMIDRRLGEAKWALVNTNESLVSLARKVGYENTNHFSNLFFKRTGLTPLDYRRDFSAHHNK